MTNKLQIRDIFILHILAGLGVSRGLDLAYLAGFNSHSYFRNRIALLIKSKLIDSEYVGREKVYFLTSKGYLMTERLRRAYKVNSQLIHDIGVTRICTYLYLTQGISYADLMTDRQMFYFTKSTGIHRPDIVLDNICYEFERTIKTYKYIESNLITNSKFDGQVWILNKKDQRLLKKIEELAVKNFLENVSILFYEDIDSYVRSSDLTINKMRLKPSLEKRNFDILLENPKNREFDLYFNYKNDQEEEWYV